MKTTRRQNLIAAALPEKAVFDKSFKLPNIEKVK
jgi:hypothetical protein